MGKVSNLKIGQRVSYGFGAVLVVLAGVGGLGYYGLQSVGDNFIRYRELARDGNLTAAMEVDVIQARLNVKDYLLKHTEEAKKEIAKFFHETEELLALADREIQHPSRRVLLAEAKQSLTAYERAFDRVASLDRENRTLQHDRLDATGPAMEKELTAIMRSAKADGDSDAAYNAGETLRSLLLARLYVQKFEVNHDKASADRVHAELDVVGKNLAGLAGELKNPERRGLAADAARLFALYKAGFDEKVRITNELTEIIAKQLDPNGRTVTRASDEIRASIKADQDALGPVAQATVIWSENLGAASTILGVLVGGILAWLVGRSISRPIISITEVMKRLAEGDKSVSVPFAGHQNELGDMARAVEVFKVSAREAERLAAEQAIEEEAKGRRSRRLDELTRGFEAAVGTLTKGLSSAAGEMQGTAQTMSATAEQTNLQASTVAMSAEQTSSNVQTVAAATEELSASIQEISRQVADSSRIAGRAADDARRTDATVQELAAGAQKIDAVVALINDIAAQTNLLALNATIEAARAGEAGRGFAVVASEVKSLAGQTTKATEDIRGQVAQIQGATKEAVTAIQGIVGIIQEINDTSMRVAAAVEEQGAATQEIARNVQQAAAGTQEVTSNIGEVRRAAGDTGAAAGLVLGAAQELSRHSESLGREVQSFLSDVAAA